MPAEMVLHWVNVVILANFHNPSILNPDFLEKQGIVPSDWKALDVLTTSAIATIKYDKKVTFLLDPNRLEIRKECEAFQEDYDIHNVAIQYVNILPHVPYIAVGLNWHISFKQDKPERFLEEHFINQKAWKDTRVKLVRASLNLSLEVDNVQCNLGFSPGKARISSSEDYYPAVLINANFDHKGPFLPNQAIAIDAIINKWKDRERYLKVLIPKLLGKGL